MAAAARPAPAASRSSAALPRPELRRLGGVDLDEVGAGLEAEPERLAADVERDARAGRPAPRAAAARPRRRARRAAASRRRRPSVASAATRAAAASSASQCSAVELRAGLVELGQRLAVGDRQADARLARPRHGVAGHALLLQRGRHPAPGVAAEQRDRVDVGAERVRGARRVERLAARDGDDVLAGGGSRRA